MNLINWLYMSILIDSSIYLYAQEHNFNEVLTSYVQLNSLLVWSDILLKDFDIDGDLMIPKHNYVFLNSLYENYVFLNSLYKNYAFLNSLYEPYIHKGDARRVYCFNKAQKFTKRDDFEDHVKLDFNMNPIEFYEQFSHDELESIGI